MRERDLESAGGQEERDGIGAILEEVINRYESKIDLFCSSSRGREVSSRARIHLHTISHTLPPCWRIDIAGVAADREHLSRGTFARYIDCDASASSR